MTDPIFIPAWVDGKLTPVEKIDVHMRGLKHKAVSVFVMNKGRILIQQRALHKYHTPGLWANSCCTHPKWNEDGKACAARRTKEELGISGLEYTHRGCFEYRANVGGGMVEHEVVDVFLAEASDRLDFTVNAEEVAATQWITAQDLHIELKTSPNNFTPWLHIYMAEYAQVIFDSK